MESTATPMGSTSSAVETAAAPAAAGPKIVNEQAGGHAGGSQGE
jgi:hypothetical protein